MTREEAIKGLKVLRRDFSGYKPNEEMFDIAIEALEQEPKIGSWVYDYEHSDWLDVTYECSCCKRTIIVPYKVKNEVYKDYPYCHCGAKMAESGE